MEIWAKCLCIGYHYLPNWGKMIKGMIFPGTDPMSDEYKIAVSRTDPAKERERLERIRKDYAVFTRVEKNNTLMIPGLIYGGGLGVPAFCAIDD
jgi:hypothetical protein